MSAEAATPRRDDSPSHGRVAITLPEEVTTRLDRLARTISPLDERDVTRATLIRVVLAFWLIDAERLSPEIVALIHAEHRKHHRASGQPRAWGGAARRRQAKEARERRAQRPVDGAPSEVLREKTDATTHYPSDMAPLIPVTAITSRALVKRLDQLAGALGLVDGRKVTRATLARVAFACWLPLAELMTPEVLAAIRAEHAKDRRKVLW